MSLSVIIIFLIPLDPPIKIFVFSKYHSICHPNTSTQTIGKQVEVKTDKKGKPYTLFSAYSSEKDGDNYAYTWIRFMQFDTTKADWVQAKAGINAKGDLQVGAYNDRLDLTCRVTEFTPWEKKAASTNQ